MVVLTTNDVVILDRTMAYTFEDETPTNELAASGFHLITPDVRRLIEDYISSGDDAMTMEVVVEGDELRALKFLNSIGGYAVFPVYSGTESQTFEGYLVIKDTGGKVCTLDGGVNLSSGTITMVTLLEGVIFYLNNPTNQGEFGEEEDPLTAVSDAILAVSALVNFPVA